MCVCVNIHKLHIIHIYLFLRETKIFDIYTYISMYTHTYILIYEPRHLKMYLCVRVCHNLSKNRTFRILNNISLVKLIGELLICIYTHTSQTKKTCIWALRILCQFFLFFSQSISMVRNMNTCMCYMCVYVANIIDLVRRLVHQLNVQL